MARYCGKRKMKKNIENMLCVREYLGYNLIIKVPIHAHKLNNLLIEYKTYSITNLITKITKQHPKVGKFRFIIIEDGTN